MLLALGVFVADAQGPPSEFEIQAVYLVKFIQFVDWPASAFPAEDSPLVVGVLGSDPFGGALDDMVKGEVVKQHRVVVRRFRSLREYKDSKDVQVLYVSASEKSHLRNIVDSLRDRSVLTTSDLGDFSSQGGIVRFFIENKKVHFCINIDAAKRANLQISSKLLQLAEVVHDPPR